MYNTLLEVAIGLVFIYLLYSLLATTIKEFIATIFSYRGRMLERGLEQMLDGKNFSFYWWDRIVNFFLWLGQWNKVRSNPGGKIDSTTFLSTTTINLPNGAGGQLAAASANSTTDRSNAAATDPSKNPEEIKRWKLNEKANLFAANITNHPIYTRTAENALFAKKPAYLSADNFSSILIDVLGENKTTGTNQLPSMGDIANFVAEKLKDNPELQKILNIYIEQANNDVLQFKTLVENWFNGTMNRVSGWYKKQANRILIMIGLCLAITFNVSTIDIVRTLSTDRNVREAMVKSASEYINKHIDSVHENKRKSAVADSTADTTKSAPTLAGISARVDSIKALYNADLGETNTTLGLGWNDFGYSADSLKWAATIIINKRDPKNETGGKPAHPGLLAKIWYVLCQTAKTPHYWLGFLITAFAISLGAPFWFDLLNRFVNLRASGAKPAVPASKPDAKKN